MTENERRSFVVSSSHDPAAIAILAQFYSSRGMSMGGSFGELMNTLVEEVMLFHGLSIEGVSQEQSVTTLNALGFSTKQLKGTRGKRRAAKRAHLEEIRSSNKISSLHYGIPSLPTAIQAKLDGSDMDPWTKDEIVILVENSIITSEQAEQAEKALK